MKNFHSIRFKIILSVLIINLSFICLLMLVWYNSLKKQAEQTAVDNMNSAINVSETAFENQIQDILYVETLTTVQTNNSLSTNILNILNQESLSPAEIVAYRRSASDFLISLCSFKKNLNGLMLCNFSGDNVSYGNPTSYDTIVSNKWLKALGKTPESTLFIEPHFRTLWYANESDMVFSVVKPVFSNTKQQIGFVIADINCQLFDDSFGSIPAYESSLMVVNDATRNVLYTTAYRKAGATPEKETKLDKNLSDKITGNSGSFFATQKGIKYLVAYRKSDLSGWDTISMVPVKKILTGFTDTIRKVLLFTFLLLLLQIILITNSVTLFTSNITRLTSAVKGIGETHMSLDLNIRSHDEIAELYLQFASMLERIRSLIQQVQHKEQEKREAEISALQFQMNPHFLYNTLNTIKFLASIQGIDNIQKVAELLSSLMHTSMDGRSVIPIAEDIQFIQNYLLLQTYRQTNLFTYELCADQNIMNYRIPKLLVQPLVENTLKHGISGKTVGGHIVIRYQVIDFILHITVEDNGIGMSSEKIQEILNRQYNSNAGHIGIYNLRKRIRLLYGKEYDVTVTSVPNEYTHFEITLPLLTGEKENHAENISG